MPKLIIIIKFAHHFFVQSLFSKLFTITDKSFDTKMKSRDIIPLARYKSLDIIFFTMMYSFANEIQSVTGWVSPKTLSACK